FCVFFFFNDTATTEIYTLSLHDALPISQRDSRADERRQRERRRQWRQCSARSEEHTSELQSLAYLVCRLLLENNIIDVGGAVFSLTTVGPANDLDVAREI